MIIKRRQFLSLTLLSSLSIILYGCFKPSPGKTVEKFHRSIEKGELEEAINLFSASVTNNFGKDKLKLAMSQGVTEIKDKGGIKSFKINNEEITGDIAKVNYTIQYGNESTNTDTVELIKEDGEWKISPKK